VRKRTRDRPASGRPGARSLYRPRRRDRGKAGGPGPWRPAGFVLPPYKVPDGLWERSGTGGFGANWPKAERSLQGCCGLGVEDHIWMRRPKLQSVQWSSNGGVTCEQAAPCDPSSDSGQSLAMPIDVVSLRRPTGRAGIDMRSRFISFTFYKIEGRSPGCRTRSRLPAASFASDVLLERRRPITRQQLFGDPSVWCCSG
jgi:hypothetical protein